MKYLRQVFLGFFQLSLAAFFIIFAVLFLAPDQLSNYSPYDKPGPATLIAVENAPDFMKDLASKERWKNLAIWPKWANDGDKDNVIRTNELLKKFEFSKFNDARNSIVEDMRNRNVDPGELYGVAISDLLGGKNAASMALYILVMSLYGGIAIGVIGKAVHNVWFNHFYFGGFSAIAQASGMYFLGVLVASLVSFSALAVIGLVVAAHPGIFFLLAEFMVYMGGLSIIFWALSLITAPGFVSGLIPKRKKTKVKGGEAGYRARAPIEQARPSADDLYIQPIEIGADDDDEEEWK